MALFRLANPEMVINNDPINVVPNTTTYKDGFGENNVSVVANGTNTELVVSTNLETKKGMVTTTIASTNANAQLVRNLKNQPGANVIKLGDPDTDFTRTLTSATLITDPEVQIQNEGVIELEFEGNTLV